MGSRTEQPFSSSTESKRVFRCGGGGTRLLRLLLEQQLLLLELLLLLLQQHELLLRRRLLVLELREPRELVGQQRGLQPRDRDLELARHAHLRSQVTMTQRRRDTKRATHDATPNASHTTRSGASSPPVTLTWHRSQS